MQILFAISVLCFVGILWAALALARHIKASQLHSSVATYPQQDFKYHLFTATEVVPKVVPETFSATSRGVRHDVLRQSVHEIAANKQWTLPLQAVHMDRLLGRAVEAAESVSTMRKPPLPTRHGRMELLDPAYFNKDLGDLTDPQPTKLRMNERSRPNSSKRY